MMSYKRIELSAGRRIKEKVNCKRCKHFNGIKNSEIIDIAGSDTQKLTIRCSVNGLVMIIGGVNQLWIHCGKYEVSIPEESKVKNTKVKENEKPKMKAKTKEKCALKVWKEANGKTVGDISEILGISMRQTNRYLAGEPMSPFLAGFASRITGIAIEKFVFTPQVIEQLCLEIVIGGFE